MQIVHDIMSCPLTYTFEVRIDPPMMLVEDLSLRILRLGS
jgi:hypothetical protein